MSSRQPLIHALLLAASFQALRAVPFYETEECRRVTQERVLEEVNPADLGAMPLAQVTRKPQKLEWRSSPDEHARLSYLEGIDFKHVDGTGQNPPQVFFSGRVVWARLEVLVFDPARQGWISRFQAVPIAEPGEAKPAAGKRDRVEDPGPAKAQPAGKRHRSGEPTALVEDADSGEEPPAAPAVAALRSRVAPEPPSSRSPRGPVKMDGMGLPDGLWELMVDRAPELGHETRRGSNRKVMNMILLALSQNLTVRELCKHKDALSTSGTTLVWQTWGWQQAGVFKKLWPAAFCL